MSIRRASVNEAAEQRIKVTSVLTKFRQHPGALVNHPDYTGGVWLLVTIDATTLETKPVRLNISLPQGLVSKIDGYVKAHGTTRFGFLAQAARKAMQ